MITSDELLNKYTAHLRTIPSINGSTSKNKSKNSKGSANNYRPALKGIPFDYIKDVMDKWEVHDDYESIIGLKDTSQKCSQRSYDLWQYYLANIQPIINEGESYNYLQLVVNFINAGDILYALTIVDIVSGIAELANRYKIEYNKEMKKRNREKDQISFPNSTKEDYFSKCRPALNRLKEFLQLNKEFIQNVNSKIDLDSERKKVNKSLVYKIDGAVALAREIGIDKFIQYAIDQCYFFEPKVAQDRMHKICSCYSKGVYLYARNSESFFKDTTDYSINSNGKYGQIGDELNDRDFQEKVVQDNEIIKKDNGLHMITVKKDTKHRVFTDPDTYYKITKYPIIIDTDGNEKLRSIINVDYTGYTISTGKGGIFQNYRISHVWGRAYDPRFFTNLWNVVLVPAWANDLLDKPNPEEGSLESMLKSTIMRICEVLYFNSGCIANKRWNELGLSKPEIINEGKDIVKPKSGDNGYWINIIKGKSENNWGKKGKEVGHIVRKQQPI